MAYFLGLVTKVAFSPIIFACAFVAYKLADKKTFVIRVLIYVGVGLLYAVFFSLLAWIAKADDSIQALNLILGFIAFMVDLGIVLLIVKIISLFKPKEPGSD